MIGHDIRIHALLLAVLAAPLMANEEEVRENPASPPAETAPEADGREPIPLERNRNPAFERYRDYFLEYGRLEHPRETSDDEREILEQCEIEPPDWRRYIEIPWVERYQDALAQAREEDRLILIFLLRDDNLHAPFC